LFLPSQALCFRGELAVPPGRKLPGKKSGGKLPHPKESISG